MAVKFNTLRQQTQVLGLHLGCYKIMAKILPPLHGGRTLLSEEHLNAIMQL